MVPMRLSATVAHALPGIRLRLRDGDETLLHVVREPVPVDGVISPCAYRSAVTRAHCQIEAGHRLRFLGLDEGVAPAIDIAVASGDRIHPGGLYRIAMGDAQVHAFATTVAPRSCRRILGDELLADGGILLHHDSGTEVTLVHAIRTGTDAAQPPPPLEEAMLRCADEELAHELLSLTAAGQGR